MCYSEPTECSKNPVMFSLHLQFSNDPWNVSKQPVKVSFLPVDGVTRVSQNPPEVLKLHLPECRNNPPEVLKLHF